MLRNSPVFVVLLLWTAGLCAAAQFAKLAIAIPELALIYPNSVALLGLTVSLISLVGAVFGLCAGAVANGISLHRLLLFGLVSGAVISLIQSYELPLELLLASRILEGFSHLAIVISAPTLISVASNDRWRSSTMTLWGTFFGVSFALTAVLGLPLIRAHGVDALFLAHGLITGIVAIGVARLLSAPTPTSTVDSTRKATITAMSVTPKARPSFNSILGEYKRALSSPRICAPAAGWLFYTLTFVALLAILPDVAEPELRGVTATFLPIASIASSLIIGVVLLQWMSAVQVICTGFVAAIVSAILLALMPGSLFVSLLLFASLGLVQGASFAAIPQLNSTTSDQILANGALAQAGNIGNLLGTPVMITVLSMTNLDIMLSAIIMCYVMALTSHFLLSRRRHRARNSGCRRFNS